LNPIMSTDGFLGGMWADREGYIDTTGTVHAYAKAAKKRGASYFEHTKVESLEQTRRRLERRHRQGHDHLRARGQRRRSLGQAGGPHGGDRAARFADEAPLPDLDTIPKLEEIDFEVPMTVDLEGFTYLRQDQKGVLLGIYEVNTEHWAMDGAPWDYGMELFQEQTDRIEHELTLGFERYPTCSKVGVKTWVNGAFTFSPDGNPLVGPVPASAATGRLRGDGGLPAGRRRGQDAGRMDDPRRTGGRRLAHGCRALRALGREPRVHPPDDGPVLFPPLRDDLSERAAAGGPPAEARACLFRDDGGGVPVGPVLGPRVPLYFGGKGFEETPSLKRSNAHDVVGAECRACARAWAFSISRLLPLRGVGAERGGVARPADGFSTTLPKPGRARLAVALGHDGRLKGDLTLFNWGDGTWWIMGSLLPADLAHALVQRPHAGRRSRCATWARTWRASPWPVRNRAR
jgi:dimethylglycine dehydrogenase